MSFAQPKENSHSQARNFVSIALRSSLILAAMVLAVVLAVRWVSPQDLRSLSKADYDRAFNKWRSQGVKEYEIVTNYSAVVPYAGTWTLQVNNGQIKIISWLANYGNHANDKQIKISPTIEELSNRYPNFSWPENLRFLTVEGMFDDIGKTRNYLQSGSISEIDEALDYHVRFHQDLGYPTVYETYPKPDVFDIDWQIRVESLKILK